MRRAAPSLCAVVAVVLLGHATSAAQTTPGLESDLADRTSERAQVEEQLGRTRAAEGDARDRLAAADAELDAVTAELAAVETALADATQRRDAARADAERLRAELAVVEADLVQAEGELDVVQERYEGRVAGAFKRGGVSNESAVVHQILAQDDIADALAVAPFLTAVMDADRRDRDDVRDLLGDVQDQRADAAQLRVDGEHEARTADRAAEDVARQVAEQERLTDAVAARRADRETALEALEDDRGAIESHLAGLDAESSRIRDQLAAIAADQAAQAERAAVEAAAAAQRAAQQAAAEAPDPSPDPSPDASPDASPAPAVAGDGDGDAADPAPAPVVDDVAPPASGGGGWTRPTGGAVTSPFGPRWGRNHNGVDLGGSVGTTVVASRGGTVVSVTASCHPTSSSGCGGGFGNHVVVSHDGGMGTIYAHLSSVAVGVGQPVSAGQGIGAVGNSGNSYGAHLHFEVRQGGAPVNPCGYIAC